MPNCLNAIKLVRLLPMLAGVYGMPLMSETLTDPTQPADSVLNLMPEAQSGQQSGMLTLSGLQENGKGSVAIINNTMVRIGDQIQGFTLLSVKHRTAVLMDASGKKQTLQMVLTDYRQPATAFNTKKKQKHKHHVVKQASKTSSQ